MSEIKKSFYRDIEISMSRRDNGDRDWTISPQMLPSQQGIFRHVGGSGTYAGAMNAAEAAIDNLLGPPPERVRRTATKAVVEVFPSKRT